MPFNIGIIGTGYVGLVTGTCLADVGNSVLCVDVDAQKIERMRGGDPIIFEKGLDRLLERNLKEGRITFTLDLAEAVRTCTILMFCLPTPPGKDGSADLAAVVSVANHTARILHEEQITEPKIVVNKSTVPVGTAAMIEAIFAEHAPNADVHIVSNPEFLSEGVSVDDFMKPERVIVGTKSEYAKKAMVDLYQPFVRSGAPIYCFDVPSAEVTKYAANAFLATKISFMNDLSKYCEIVGADVDNVRRGISADSRIATGFLYAGVGYGGSCFPKDVKAIIHSAKALGMSLEVIEATERVNHKQLQRFIQRILDRFDGDVAGKHFAVWGLSFKPNTDDIRDAPSLEIIRALTQRGATVSAFDPEAIANTQKALGDMITYAPSMYDATVGADALIIPTEWNEFRKPMFSRVKEQMKQPLIFDGRNLYTLDEAAEAGFEYYSVGRASVIPDA